jgi:hypothetical protein
MASYNNTLGADGEIWKQVIDGSFDALKVFLQAKYGPDTVQQVVQNPNSDYSQSLLREFMQYQMMQNNNQQQLPQQQEKDNTMLYVALGIGALALIMMMNNNDSRRR